MEEISRAIVDHGFAVVAAICLFVSLSAVFRFLLGMLLREIKTVQEKVDKSHVELRRDLMTRSESTHEVAIRLVDRVRSLDDQIVRMDVLIRLLNDLPPVIEKIGKGNAER